jgi:hypothetical protein
VRARGVHAATVAGTDHSATVRGASHSVTVQEDR